MSTLITILISFAVGFVVGSRFGSLNKGKVDQATEAAKKAVETVKEKL